MIQLAGETNAKTRYCSAAHNSEDKFWLTDSVETDKSLMRTFRVE